MPRLYTSSWLTQLPPQLARIGISRGTPRGQPAGYRMYRRLAPGAWFARVSPEEYTQRYHSEILAKLDPQKTVDELLAMAGGKIPALLCFEPPQPTEAWCHRALVSVWLQEALGLEVYEYGQEQHGFGACHPKLHPQARLLV